MSNLFLNLIISSMLGSNFCQRSRKQESAYDDIGNTVSRLNRSCDREVGSIRG